MCEQEEVVVGVEDPTGQLADQLVQLHHVAPEHKAQSILWMYMYVVIITTVQVCYLVL